MNASGRWKPASRRWSAAAALALAALLTSSCTGQSPDSAASVTAASSTVTPSDAPTASVTATATAPLPVPPTAAATSAPTPAPPGAPPGVALPNGRLTPGATFVATAAQVCTPGWAAQHRSVALAQYHEVYGEYGIPYPQPSGTYELDHLIPLELGGDNANANLWPEPAAPTPGFHQKDGLENVLHDLVCSGSLSLVGAQQAIASNWYAAYVRYGGG